MRKQFLPIGSVVLLEDADKRLMIYGIMQIGVADGKQYDYISCLYPEGFLDKEHTYLFNHEDIQRVDFIGFVDAEQEILRSRISAMVDESEEVK